MSDWSLLPEVLLNIISTQLENCFVDIIHARSVCSSWRSSFPYPSCLLRSSYSLPTFVDYPFESKELCTLEKVPMSLFRARAPRASEYLFGGLSQDESEDHMELPSPIQCSVKFKIPGSDKPLMNMLDCEILPLCNHHQYRMIGWETKKCTTYYRSVVVLPVNKEGREKDFVVVVNYYKVLLVLTSAEMRWKRLMNIPDYPCTDLVTFRGRFYAVFFTGKTVVIDPYSLEVTPLMPSPYNTLDYLIPCGNDELFLAEVTSQVTRVRGSELLCRVSTLDEEAGEWVEVTDLGDRVLFIVQLANVASRSIRVVVV